MPFLVTQAENNFKAENLIAIFNTENWEKEIVDSLLTELEYYFYEEPAEGIAQVDKILSIAKQDNHHHGIIGTHISLSILYEQLQEMGDAQNFLNTLFIYCQQKQDSTCLSDVHAQLGNLLSAQNRYSEALVHFLEAVAISEKLDNKKALMYDYNGLATFYADVDSLEKAKAYYLKIQALAVEAKDSGVLMTALNNLGDYYLNKQDFQTAEQHFKEVALLNEQFDGDMDYYIDINLGITYAGLHYHELSIDHFNKALDEATCCYAEADIADVHNLLGDLYVHLEKYGEAKSHFEKAHTFAINIAQIDILKTASEGLATIYEKEKQYAQALTFFKKAQALADSIENLQQNNEISRLLLQNEYEQKQQQLEAERQLVGEQQKGQRLWYLLLLACGIGGIAWLFAFAQRYRAKLKVAQVQQAAAEQLVAEKNKELTSQTLFLARQNEAINQTYKKLVPFQRKLNVGDRKQFNQFMEALRATQNQEMWKEFEMRFKDVHQDFYNQLQAKFPDLTSSDRRLCALLKLHLNTKEIAELTYQAPSSIEVARSRLRKKLGMEDRNVSLVAYLEGI